MRSLAAAMLLCAAASSALAQQKPARPPLAPAAPAPPAPGRPVDVAYGAYQRGLYITALREALARTKADENDAAAQTLLGELYAQGLGVRRDPGEAAVWYRAAAARGSIHAMAALGMMALEGRGLPRDRKAARDWLEKAAEGGQPIACYNLALLFLDEGSDANIARAVKLLVVAAGSEIADAQHALGVVHARGLGGITRDRAEAARLFQRATYNGSIAGEVELAILAFNGDGIPKDEGLAARHFRHAAARGNAIAQNRLARLYVIGRGVRRDLAEALSWHTLAKNQGREDLWLEEQLKDVSAEDRTRAERLAKERSNF